MPYLHLIAIVHSSSSTGVCPAINTVLTTSNANRCSGVNTANRNFIGRDRAG